MLTLLRDNEIVYSEAVRFSATFNNTANQVIMWNVVPPNE